MVLTLQTSRGESEDKGSEDPQEVHTSVPREEPPRRDRVVRAVVSPPEEARGELERLFGLPFALEGDALVSPGPAHEELVKVANLKLEVDTHCRRTHPRTPGTIRWSSVSDTPASMLANCLASPVRLARTDKAVLTSRTDRQAARGSSGVRAARAL